MTKTKPRPDLNALLESSGSTRVEARKPQERQEKQPVARGRAGTRPITVHFPKNVRDQLKFLAIDKDTTLHSLVAEAFNDLFAKHGKPEIAPRE